jgi:MOSC domain-containing protein YiiM
VEKTFVNLGEGRIEGLQVGKVRHLVASKEPAVDFRHAHWTSGIFKTAVADAVHVKKDGLSGDEQADLENHGGPDNVVRAYDAAHYPAWRERLGMPELGYGGFGENFTVRGVGLTDDVVCIGDVWEVGEGEGAVLLQVTQARQPCYKLARRLGQPHIVKMVHENSWGGWYLRVLREGMVEAGMGIRVVERRHVEWTVARAVQVMYARKREPGEAAELARVAELSARWKRELISA